MPKKNAARAGAESTSRKAVQSAPAATAAAMQNFTSSTAEATGLEQISWGEDVEGRWKAFFEGRWKRRRQLLPNLALNYPDANEMQRIAQLAEVRDTSAFAHSIKSIILDAHLNHQVFRTLSIPKVRKAINAVAKKTKELREQLWELVIQLDVGSASKGSLMKAGFLIEAELYTLRSLMPGGMVQLPEYVALLDVLNTCAQRAAGRSISSPRGAGGNPAFDMFIEQLLMAAWRNGGKWTNYRSKEGPWTGTLLGVVEILRKYLPQGQFIPVGELGRAVDYIKDKLERHIAQFEASSKDRLAARVQQITPR